MICHKTKTNQTKNVLPFLKNDNGFTKIFRSLVHFSVDLFSSLLFMLYSHLRHHNDTIIKTQWITDAKIKTQEDFFIKNIYLSLYCKGSKRVTQGSSTIQLGLLRAPSAGCGFPYHFSAPTGTQTPLSYIMVQRPLNLWNRMFDRHQAEITVMQFTGHSLPVHQSISVPWEFFSLSHFISQFPPTRFPLLTAIGMCHFLLVHHLEWHFGPGQKVKTQHLDLFSSILSRSLFSSLLFRSFCSLLSWSLFNSVLFRSFQFNSL